MNLSSDHINAIVHLIRAEVPEVQVVYVFGSYATGQENEQSDLDIAFLAEADLSGLALYNLRQTLAAKLKKDVDIIQLKDASLVLRNEVVQGGEPIFTADGFDRPNYEMLTISTFLDFQETTRGLREDIKKRGYVRK